MWLMLPVARSGRRHIQKDLPSHSENVLRRPIPDPNALRGRLTQMNTRRRTPRDRERHRLVIFAPVDAHANARTKLQPRDEIQKLRILFVHAQDFVSPPNFSFRQTYSPKFATQLSHAPEQRHSMRAAAVAPKTFQQKLSDFRRNSMFP